METTKKFLRSYVIVILAAFALGVVFFVETIRSALASGKVASVSPAVTDSCSLPYEKNYKDILRSASESEQKTFVVNCGGFF